MTRTLRTAALAVAALLVAPTDVRAAAEKFPDRPVRMVVPFPPGSASDFLARVLGQKLVEAWHPKIEELLKSEGFTAPREVKLVFKNQKTIAFANTGSNGKPRNPSRNPRGAQAAHGYSSSACC
jgi:tripartite-type tricarboxylate transporter receptor subunit TctC